MQKWVKHGSCCHWVHVLMVKTDANKSAKCSLVNEICVKHVRALERPWWVLPTGLLEQWVFFELGLSSRIILPTKERGSILQIGMCDDFVEQGGERMEIRLERWKGMTLVNLDHVARGNTGTVAFVLACPSQLGMALSF